MEGVKKFVNILVMIYLVAAALIYLGILNVGQASNPDFYTTFFMVGGILMLIELLAENLYIVSLKRGHVQTQQKINELKASLYDQQQEVQEIKKRHADELAATFSLKDTSYATKDTSSTPFSEPALGAPTGTNPIPPMATPITEPYPNVIITPSPTPGIQNPERRLPQNSDS
ncbi:hypothetical protein [Adhaeribacter aquaticus]|uniref:hypothetical protein n=1 Tax=Adhaeribacter aquaticus TaxID=299567 RepID=UPI0003FE3486|nr:hypothetical protein [Adhaeribacter aquaticus]